jgi:hypothetical protein
VLLSVKLVETKRHNVYDLVYLLLKLVFILSVTMTSVERAFSTINFIKNRLRNRMNNNLLDDHLITFIECDVFLDVKKEDIIIFFMAIRRHMLDKNIFMKLLHFYCKLTVYVLWRKKIVDPP